jgi:transcriptional regulator
MHQNPFVVLSGVDKNGKPVATQIPVFVDEREGKMFLSGHMMRQTDHHLAFTVNNDVLVLFTGAHCYVSAGWYTEPLQASTWNYMTVHARGKLEFLNQEALIQILKRTTDHFEGSTDTPSAFDRLPAEYVQRLSKAIIAFEIEVEDIQNVFKLRQNRDEKSYLNIIGKLECRPDEDSRTIAAEMKKRLM